VLSPAGHVSNVAADSQRYDMAHSTTKTLIAWLANYTLNFAVVSAADLSSQAEITGKPLPLAQRSQLEPALITNGNTIVGVWRERGSSEVSLRLRASLLAPDGRPLSCMADDRPS
jgi:hypothetical protein